jgi:NADH-quinone oxidoreductase subunit N
LIDASVAGDYTWLGIAIVIGSVISMGYYLRVIAVMWMGSFELELPGGRVVKRAAGWSPEADLRAQPEVAFVAILFAVATIAFGLWPDPLFDAARDIGSALSQLR